MTQTVPPETVALARHRYLEGATREAILAETGLKLWQLYRCLDGAYDDGSGAALPALPRRVIRSRRISRAALVKRALQSAEAQVAQIENKLAASGLKEDGPPGLASERELHSLAVLARTLRDLAAADAVRKPNAKRERKPEPNHAEPVPRDLTELRRSLARKLDALVADEEGPLPGEPQ